ncbi:tail fiber domain-containing protein, partial [Candidatus Dependentiae bacterium]|nr:tail fiber domain-containing protein [Candidatus Dependentiae bacterium]
GKTAGGSLSGSATDNTLLGYDAGAAVSTGDYNVVIGSGAGAALAGGNNNIIISNGASGAGSTVASGANNIYIGANAALSNESNTIRIGNTTDHSGGCYMSPIYGATVNSGTGSAVYVDSNGLLGTILSSSRYKEEIQDLGTLSASLRNLRPVSFVYKGDADRVPQYGLIAEEVETVMPELVIYNKDKQAETVRYHLLPAMLLNEYQQQDKRVNALEQELAALREQIKAMGDKQEQAAA